MSRLVKVIGEAGCWGSKIVGQDKPTLQLDEKFIAQALDKRKMAGKRVALRVFRKEENGGKTKEIPIIRVFRQEEIGATREVGAALTRICLRHRAVESRVKTLTSALVECVVVPLQEKVEEWRRSHHAFDKDHTKEYKKARTEIKKRTENAARLQKKAKKAGKNSELNKVLESTVVDLRARYGVLEEVERSAVRQALTEERARYCAFAHALRPVLDEEVGLVSELGHLQEVMNQLEKHVADPHTLPPASEQVLLDIKGGETQWSWQTPPSSPSSLGSRKSSMCSISSLNSSSSSSTHSPSHHNRTRSVSQ
ncbi:protein MTSS 1-like, partial [Homarus americanus]|uniref:protein MTSS 1-like n=1 Tax=Homarus americanus TaxID=6706 RepID=UPI001C483CF7